MRLDAETPEIHYRGGIILNQFDAIIPRIRPSITFYGCALTRQFEVKSVLPQLSSSNHAIKIIFVTIAIKQWHRIPTTGFYNSPLDTNDLIKMVGGSRS
jgi:ribosomal protein S6--L-glutamate ligase